MSYDPFSEDFDPELMAERRAELAASASDDDYAEWGDDDA